VVAPLPLAARYPMLAWRIGWLALLLAPLVPAAWWGDWPWGPGQIFAMLGVFCLAGIRQQRPELWWMWALTLIPWWLWLAGTADPNGPAAATVVFTAVVIAADNIGSRLRVQYALAAQTERAEDERARRAVLEERTRIARELHDVVAHHMSLIAVRAETAPYRLTGLPESARDEFGSLSEVAREALAEMRRLLGVLRHDGPADLAPQPELADLPSLVDTARRAGLSVQLSAPAALDHVPAGVGLCAYRIVQESLSNASQHAPGAAVTERIGRRGHKPRHRAPPLTGDHHTSGARRPGRRRLASVGWTRCSAPAR
jgi:signal transduction histidine kinase